MRVALAVTGTLGAAAHLLYGIPLAAGEVLSFAPAIVMAVTLLSGWRLALVAAAALSTIAALHPQLQPAWVALCAGASVLCGEALRRGIGPLPVWLVQMLVAPGAIIQSLFLPPAHGYPAVLAGAAAQAGINVALAVALLLLLPRRSATFPARCRSRWVHLAFICVIGCVAAGALAVLAGQGLQSSSAALQLSVVLVLALLATHLLNLWYRTATHRLRRDVRAASRGVNAREQARQRARWPVELATSCAESRRRTHRLQLEAARSKRQLLELRRVAVHLQADLKRNETALRHAATMQDGAGTAAAETQARYSILMEQTGDAALFVDGSGTITAASRSVGALLGLRPEDLVGKPLATLIPHHHVTPHPFDSMESQSPGAEASAVVAPVCVAAGKSREVETRIQTFPARGARHRLVWLREHHQEARAALEEVKRISRTADQARDVFVATMSHELRTPLHGLIATLDMLRAESTPTEAFQRQLSIARSSARALLKIANDVLDVTRIKSNLFTLERRRFSMTTILREVVEEASARAASLGLSLSAEGTDNLPPSFTGDPGRLKQILGNLVSNALKFTATGGVTLRVHYDGKLCTVDVVDTGEGIPAEKRSCIFDPFVQLGSNARQAGGTGLGLPISRRLAEAMKGQLTLHQSGPKGSTFRLTLPLEACNEPPPDEDSQRIFTNPSGRILVVEDNPANRYVAEALLAGMGCPATIVEGGQEALDRLQEEEFDLILMDCQMPGMDGYETTRRVRQLLERRIPIIAMTANAMADDRSHCLAAGMDDFLPKPFNRQALNTILCKWLAPGSNAATEGTTDLDARIGMHPDLDIGVFDELRESLQWKNEPLQRIRASFTSSVERILPLLENPGADPQALQRHLHTLMGSSGMVGARQVEYMAGQMQRAFRENRPGALDGAAGILRHALQRYERAVERRLNQGAGVLQ
jgi:PAS domain S-box-containing protein